MPRIAVTQAQMATFHAQASAVETVLPPHLAHRGAQRTAAARDILALAFGYPSYRRLAASADAEPEHRPLNPTVTPEGRAQLREGLLAQRLIPLDEHAVRRVLFALSGARKTHDDDLFHRAGERLGSPPRTLEYRARCRRIVAAIRNYTRLGTAFPSQPQARALRAALPGFNGEALLRVASGAGSAACAVHLGAVHARLLEALADWSPQQVSEADGALVAALRAPQSEAWRETPLGTLPAIAAVLSALRALRAPADSALRSIEAAGARAFAERARIAPDATCPLAGAIIHPPLASAFDYHEEPLDEDAFTSPLLRRRELRLLVRRERPAPRPGEHEGVVAQDIEVCLEDVATGEIPALLRAHMLAPGGLGPEHGGAFLEALHGSLESHSAQLAHTSRVLREHPERLNGLLHTTHAERSLVVLRSLEVSAPLRGQGIGPELLSRWLRSLAHGATAERLAEVPPARHYGDLAPGLVVVPVQPHPSARQLLHEGADPTQVFTTLQRQERSRARRLMARLGDALRHAPAPLLIFHQEESEPEILERLGRTGLCPE